MGQIQSAINTAIGTATQSIAIGKGIKEVQKENELKASQVEQAKAIEQAKNLQRQGKIKENIANLTSDIKGKKEELAKGKETLDLAKQGYEMVNLDGHMVKATLKEKDKNELIERYTKSNREMRKIISAKMMQKKGLKEELLLRGGKI